MPASHATFRSVLFSFFVGFLLLSAFAGPAASVVLAQDSTRTASEETSVYRVETQEGTVYMGTLVRESEDAVVLATRDGTEVRISRDAIRSLSAIDDDRIRNGAYWFENPHATRYLFAPSAIGLRDGTGYYQNTWVLFNNANVGITDRFSIGGGMVPAFLFGGGVFPAWILPKVSFSSPSGQAHIAAGALIGGVLGDVESASFGMLYTSSTLGDRDHNVTGGVGYGYADGTLADTPIFNLSGMTRVSRQFYFLSENYIFPGDGINGMASIGMRYAPENFAVDFALVRPLNADTGSFLAVPWLGVTIPF
ncbi:MAG: hypothetical protein R6U20_10385 [Longimonas sp.]|uniref:hypothetical protein n=1 Tax=Longimonas sp. TaxID=2039626 RepID=UPI003974E94A